MNGEWKNMIRHYQDRPLDLPLPVTLDADTALHIAVYSKQAQPLQDLLEIVKDMRNFLPDIESLAPVMESPKPEMEFLKKKNKFGNTALHEATICGNYEAVRLLVGRCPDLLTRKNKYGETPLFTAAAFAEAEIVEFFFRSNPEQCVNDECRLSDIHRKRRRDGLSILSAAIKGLHFETALMLLELDDSLHDLKGKDGVDALQLLAHMPTAFESGFPMGICERLIYCYEEQFPSIFTRKEHIPLFIATINGIEEIVWEIIDQYPHAIEKLNEEGQSILDVAVMHRQKKIFSLVKQQKVPLARLHRVIDNKGNTLLHHVADMKHYSGGTKPGPALQLQEELQWFEQVREVIPSHYATLPNGEGKTAGDLFKERHKDQLENARTWIKETTQSCSTVAALVATVVFAAAYTVPGGSDDSGKPNFIDSPYFLVFTVSDVLSLASSLTSLVVFLSLLTSPFELQDFRVSLPRKLLVGFTFLFFAVITTMLSFGATILILIQSEKKLTTLLLSIAAFLPVLVFAIMQFRLYVSFMGSTYNIRKITGKALPSFLFPCLPRGKKLHRA
ncbi:ankyrin repeat-containing protein [Salix suchowensis]|nr:ankyrin repeat-containing protein [Salix suchowensis]